MRSRRRKSNPMNFTTAQKKILSEIGGGGAPLIIVNTPPGSGKTFVASEVLNKVHDSRYLAVTFNRKAAAELQKRSGMDRIHWSGRYGTRYCTTFHSYCYNFLKERGLIDEVHLRLIGALLNGLLEKYEPRDNSLEDDQGGFSDLTAIDSIKKEMLYIYDMAVLCDKDPYQYFLEVLDTLQCCSGLADAAKIFKSFLVEKQANGYINFVDTLVMTRNRLETESDVFDYIVVDEAQDLDVMQIQILNLLMPKVRRQVLLIGDEDQKIYTWRGADHTPLVSWPAARIPLDISFRVQESLAVLARTLVQHNSQRIHKEWTGQPGNGQLRFFASSKEDSLCPIDYLLELEKKFDSITVLSRTNFPLFGLANNLLEFGVTVNSGGELCYGFGRDDAKGVVRWLEYCQDPSAADRLPAKERARLYEKLATDIKGVGIGTWTKTLEAARAKDAANQPEFGALKEIVISRGIPLFPPPRSVTGQIEIITRVVTGKEFNYLAPKLHAVYRRNLNFLESIRKPKITISSIHRFKGKEDNHIVIIGANNGQMPHNKSGDSLLEEERRLLYVAITRSRHSVDLFFNSDNPSPFLDEFGIEH
jgi:DNA helicase-2/ATP-dependent DNA helicase PcrA